MGAQIAPLLAADPDRDYCRTAEEKADPFAHRSTPFTPHHALTAEVQMSHDHSPRSTPRRGFLTRIAAGAGALVAGRAATASAELAHLAAPTDEKWLSRIKGKHRQVVDCTSHNSGFGAAFGLNFIDSTKEALSLPETEFTSVVVYRHMAMPLTLNDAMWQKYHIGEVLGINDPATNAPAVRNIYRDKVSGRPGVTYEQIMMTRPVIMAACNVALKAISGMAAPKASVTGVQAAEDWTANLLPGVVLVPSGVYALNRAQQTGCTYCGGG
jgi:intracellular sulfur oxidation DsrE/DsrF family protein